MANYYGRRNYSKSGGRSKSRYTAVEKFAFNMGRVNRGLSNPNSRVRESFDKGKQAPAKKQKKPLF